MIDDTHLALAADSRDELIAGDHAGIDAIVRDHGHVVDAGLEAGRHVVHEDHLDALCRRLAIDVGGGERVGGQRNQDIGIEGQRSLDLRHLVGRVHLRISRGDDLDAEFVELELEARKLRLGPAVGGLVHGDDCLEVHAPDLLDLSVRQLHVRGRAGRHTVGIGAPHLTLDRRNLGVGLRLARLIGNGAAHSGPHGEDGHRKAESDWSTVPD